ncbi:MAG: hypothetical protein J5786_00480 [Clostridiales bacterium]|nr:hypothetical protein [Clostridiales bacterium]
MDYAEGLFLGKLWSDTDFENRRHYSLFVLYGFFVEAIVLYTYFYEKTLLRIGNFDVIQAVIFAVLFLACPFICFRYYRMPIWGKILVIAEKVLKTMLVVSFTVSRILPHLTVKSGELQDFVINYLNSTLEEYTEKYSSSAGSFSTIIGVLTGGIHVVFMILLIVVAAVVIPGLVFLVYRLLQYCYDWAVNKLIIKRFLPSRK